MKKTDYLQKAIILCSIIILTAFTTGDTKSEYILPEKANSLCTTNIDLDVDEDILVGHIYNAGTDWTGITMMINDGNGYFEKDTFYLNGQHRAVIVEEIDNNGQMDLITQYWDGNLSYIGVMFDFFEIQNNLDSINISYYADYIAIGDINGDSYIDIVFAYNTEQQYGVIYNDGAGNFSEPEYFDTQHPPIDIETADLDGNGRDDIVIAGQNTVIYYSFESGFEEYYFSGLEHSVDLKDMDNDGDLDVLTLWGAFVTTVNLYENKGYQDFVKHTVCTVPTTSGGILTPDLNNDSFFDVSFLSGGNFKYLYNNGNFSFSEMDSLYIEGFTYGLNYTWADLDQNNYPDIMVIKETGAYVPNLKIMFNDGDGNFGENPITGIETSNFESQTSNLCCFPNPFKDLVHITFNIDKSLFAQIMVYDLNGRLINTICSDKLQKGNHKLIWNGADNNGKEVKTGTYLIVLDTGRYINTKQVVKLIN